MGLRTSTLDFLFQHVGAHPRRICELGNQHLKGDQKFKTGKELFQSLGWLHVSMDINGMDGAVSLDLCEAIKDVRLLDSFDLVTNFGTGEHIPDQWMLFKNIHDLCKFGGHMVHVVSADPKHGSWNYDPLFFEGLARRNGYILVAKPEIRPEVKGNHVSCVLLKGNLQPFENRVGFQGPVRVNDFALYRTMVERRLMPC